MSSILPLMSPAEPALADRGAVLRRAASARWASWRRPVATERAGGGEHVGTRSLGSVLLAGTLLVGIWLLLPHPAAVNELGVVLATAGSAVCAIVLLLLNARLRADRTLKVALGVVTTAVSVGIAFTGPSAMGLEVLYLWATPYAYVLLSARHAAVQTIWVGVSWTLGQLVLVLPASPTAAAHAVELPGRALTLVGTVTIVGILVRRLANAVRERDNRLRRGFGDSPLGMALIGADLRYLEVNDAMCAILGRPSEGIVGLPLSEVVHPDDFTAVGETIRASLETSELQVSFEKRFVRPDGSFVATRVSTSVIPDASGQPAYFFTQVDDITERRRAEQELDRRVRQQQAVAQVSQIALRHTDLSRILDEAVHQVADALDVEFCDVLELTQDALFDVVACVDQAGAPAAPVAGEAGASYYARFALRSRSPVVVEDFATESRFPRSGLLEDRGVVSGVGVVIEGRTRPFGVLGVHAARRHAFSADDLSFVQAVANVLSSAIERHRSDAANRHAALHDALTGLPNRALALDRIETALRRQRRTGTGVAVLVVDLDRFKVVNDSLGHAAGDELLLTMAPRLCGAMRPGDTVARLGGDEFVVICDDAGGPEQAVEIADRLANAVSQPIALRDGDHVLSASIGIAVAGEGATPESLLRDADIAMYSVKQRGRGGHALFDAGMGRRALGRLGLETELRRALDRDELRLHYQPIVDVVSGRPVAVEALVRWEHPERGLVPPLEFVPIAEETGLINRIGRWVLEEGCRQVAAWQRDGVPGLGLFVNASGRQIASPGFPEEVAEIARCSGIAPGTLALEITESVLLEDAESPLAVLASLAQSDLRVVLDDFGTGYSSLSYLKRFPLDSLKIDRGFVAGLGTDPDDSAIVEAVLRMAQTLELDVIAEGVETPEQLEGLRRLACPLAQGYLFARPMPAAPVRAWLAERLAR